MVLTGLVALGVLVWWTTQTRSRRRAASGAAATLDASFATFDGPMVRGALLPDGDALLWLPRRPFAKAHRFLLAQIEPEPRDDMDAPPFRAWSVYRVGDRVGWLRIGERDANALLNWKGEPVPSRALRRWLAKVPRTLLWGPVLAGAGLAGLLTAWLTGSDARAEVLAVDQDGFCQVRPPGGDGWIDCLGSRQGDVIDVHVQGFPFRGDVADSETGLALLCFYLAAAALILIGLLLAALMGRTVVDDTGSGDVIPLQDRLAEVTGGPVDTDNLDWVDCAQRVAARRGWPHQRDDDAAGRGVRARFAEYGLALALMGLSALMVGFAVEEEVAFGHGTVQQTATVVESSWFTFPEVARETEVRVGDATEWVYTWRSLEPGEKVDLLRTPKDHTRVVGDRGHLGSWISGIALLLASAVAALRAWRRRRFSVSRPEGAPIRRQYVAFKLEPTVMQLILLTDDRPTETCLVRWVPQPVGEVNTWSGRTDDGWWHLEVGRHTLTLLEPVEDLESEEHEFLVEVLADASA